MAARVFLLLTGAAGFSLGCATAMRWVFARSLVAMRLPRLAREHPELCVFLAPCGIFVVAAMMVGVQLVLEIGRHEYRGSIGAGILYAVCFLTMGTFVALALVGIARVT